MTDTDHPCPYTTGQLLALLAILTTRGGPTRLLDTTRTHHAKHQAHDEQQRCDIPREDITPDVTP